MSPFYGNSAHRAFLRDPAGKVYYYVMTITNEGIYSTNPYIVRCTKLQFSEVKGDHSVFPDKEELYAFSYTGSYAFFVSPLDKKSIYYYDVAKNEVGLYMRFEGNDEINFINGEYKNDNRLGVGIGNRFILLNTAESNLIETVPFEEKIIEEFEFGGKVLDFFYKRS